MEISLVSRQVMANIWDCGSHLYIYFKLWLLITETIKTTLKNAFKTWLPDEQARYSWFGKIVKNNIFIKM